MRVGAPWNQSVNPPTRELHPFTAQKSADHFRHTLLFPRAPMLRHEWHAGSDHCHLHGQRSHAPCSLGCGCRRSQDCGCRHHQDSFPEATCRRVIGRVSGSIPYGRPQVEGGGKRGQHRLVRAQIPVRSAGSRLRCANQATSIAPPACALRSQHSHAAHCVHMARSATALPAGALGRAPKQRAEGTRNTWPPYFEAWLCVLRVEGRARGGPGCRCSPGRAKTRASAQAGARGSTFWLLQQRHSTAGTIARFSRSDD
jgi:hypothetical protein